MEKHWRIFLENILNGRILKEYKNIEHYKTILFSDLDKFLEFSNNDINEFESNVDVKLDLIEIFLGDKNGKTFYILIKEPYELFENEKLIDVIELKKK